MQFLRITVEKLSWGNEEVQILMATATKRKATKKVNGHSNGATATKTLVEPLEVEKESGSWPGMRGHLERIIKEAGHAKRDHLIAELTKIYGARVNAEKPPSSMFYHLGKIAKAGRITTVREADSLKFSYDWVGASGGDLKPRGRKLGSKNRTRNERLAPGVTDAAERAVRQDVSQTSFIKHMLQMHINEIQKLIDQI